MTTAFPCPICRAASAGSARYPQALCVACASEAQDAHGRALAFSNVSLGGGFSAQYKDDRSVYASDECWVRGVHCRAGEHRFGGIVVQPIVTAESESR